MTKMLTLAQATKAVEAVGYLIGTHVSNPQERDALSRAAAQAFEAVLSADVTEESQGALDTLRMAINLQLVRDALNAVPLDIAAQAEYSMKVAMRYAFVVHDIVYRTTDTELLEKIQAGLRASS